MKKGVVMQIMGGKATIMKSGGAFITVSAKSGWRKGDVVTLPGRAHASRQLIAVAASLLVIMIGTLGTYGYVNADAALISVDMASSVELTLNRMGRVKATTAYNEEGAALLAEASVVGQPYDQAMTALLGTDTALEAMRTSDSLDVSIYASAAQEQALIETTHATLDRTQAENPQLKTFCHSVDSALVGQAHTHGMTSGKYLVFLELQAMEPDLAVEDVQDTHTGEMRRELHRHREGGRGEGGHHGGHE